MKLALPLLALATFALASCGGSTNPALAPSGAEAPLAKEINKVRTANGKKALSRSSKLDALAASESSRLAASGNHKPNIAALRERTGYTRAAVIVGSLRDRGPETGSRYPAYWMKSKREKALLLDDWHRLGVGTAKTANGELVAIVLFGNFSGEWLMRPM